MGKYIYEISFGSINTNEGREKYMKLTSEISAIAFQHKAELDRSGIKFDLTASIDFINGVMKIKPFQEDLPTQLKEELNSYFEVNSSERVG